MRPAIANPALGAGMPLEQEWQTFLNELPRLLADPANRGKFALIHGAAVLGIFGSEDEALAAGYDRHGLDPFLVQEITDEKKPKYFSHNVSRCP